MRKHPPQVPSSQDLNVAKRLAEHTEFLQRLASRLLRSPDLANDAVQETLVIAWSKNPRVSSMRGWLAGTLKNVIRHQRRSTSRRDAHHEGCSREYGRVPSILSTPESLIERQETGALVFQAMLSLPDHEREAISLRFGEGWPPRDIAAETGVPVHTVHNRIRSGLARMRVDLTERSGRDAKYWRRALMTLATPLPRSAELAVSGSAATASASANSILAGKAFWVAAIGMASILVVWYAVANRDVSIETKQHAHADFELNADPRKAETSAPKLFGRKASASKGPLETRVFPEMIDSNSPGSQRLRRSRITLVRADGTPMNPPSGKIILSRLGFEPTVARVVEGRWSPPTKWRRDTLAPPASLKRSAGIFDARVAIVERVERILPSERESSASGEEDWHVSLRLCEPTWLRVSDADSGESLAKASVCVAASIDVKDASSVGPIPSRFLLDPSTPSDATSFSDVSGSPFSVPIHLFTPYEILRFVYNAQGMVRLTADGYGLSEHKVDLGRHNHCAIRRGGVARLVVQGPFNQDQARLIVKRVDQNLILYNQPLNATLRHEIGRIQTGDYIAYVTKNRPGEILTLGKALFAVKPGATSNVAIACRPEPARRALSGSITLGKGWEAADVEVALRGAGYRWYFLSDLRSSDALRAPAERGNRAGHRVDRHLDVVSRERGQFRFDLDEVASGPVEVEFIRPTRFRMTCHLPATPSEGLRIVLPARRRVRVHVEPANPQAGKSPSSETMAWKALSWKYDAWDGTEPKFDQRLADRMVSVVKRSPLATYWEFDAARSQIRIQGEPEEGTQARTWLSPSLLDLSDDRSDYVVTQRPLFFIDVRVNHSRNGLVKRRGRIHVESLEPNVKERSVTYRRLPGGSTRAAVRMPGRYRVSWIPRESSLKPIAQDVDVSSGETVEVRLGTN